MFEVLGDYVRITGLRLQGPTITPSDNFPETDGIYVADNNFFGTLIDHNDLSAWTDAAVSVYGKGPSVMGGPLDGSTKCSPPNFNLNDNVRIARNFIHHNDENTKRVTGMAA